MKKVIKNQRFDGGENGGGEDTGTETTTTTTTTTETGKPDEDAK